MTGPDPHPPPARPGTIGCRIVILGSSGSGKTWLGRRLGDLLGIEVFHLDPYFWQPGWREPDPGEFERANRDLVANDRWIVEGNYSTTRALRLEAADTIIYLDEAPWRCAFRFVWRCWFHRRRPDLPVGCREPRMSRDLLAHVRYILRHKRHKEPRLLDEIESYRAGRQVHLLAGRTGVESFLQSIEHRLAGEDDTPPS